MFRIWCKLFTDNHLVKDITIEDSSDANRTAKVFHALESACHSFDLSVPINLRTFQNLQGNGSIRIIGQERTTAQSQSFTLANGMKPVSAVLSDNLSGFQFYDRSRTFYQETADKIIVIYLSQETDALAVFSSGTG